MFICFRTNGDPKKIAYVQRMLDNEFTFLSSSNMFFSLFQETSQYMANSTQSACLTLRDR